MIKTMLPSYNYGNVWRETRLCSGGRTARLRTVAFRKRANGARAAICDGGSIMCSQRVPPPRLRESVPGEDCSGRFYSRGAGQGCSMSVAVPQELPFTSGVYRCPQRNGWMYGG